MKEIIVVDNKAFLNKTDFVCIEDIVKDLKIEYRIEQVPETFEEVQKFCERYREKHDFESHKDFTIIDEFAVRNNGSIWLYYENIEIQTELTPKRQWQIIKNLIGE